MNVTKSSRIQVVVYTKIPGFVAEQLKRTLTFPDETIASTLVQIELKAKVSRCSSKL